MPIVHITPKSSNAKTGPIPVTTTSRDTCPPTCSWYDKGCYAKYGPLGLHWNKVTEGERGGSWSKFLKWVSGLPVGTLWRHNQAGDLPGLKEYLDRTKTRSLCEAAAHTRGFTYTHKWLRNMGAIAALNKIGGFTINTSCDTLQEARLSFENGLPTTVILPEDWEDSSLPLVQCPAEYMEGKTCENCALCWHKDRKVIVGFNPHGTGRKYITEAVNEQ